MESSGILMCTECEMMLRTESVAEREIVRLVHEDRTDHTMAVPKFAGSGGTASSTLPHSPDSLDETFRTVRSIVRSLEKDRKHGAEIADVRRKADELGIPDPLFDRAMTRLRDNGDVYEPQEGYLRTV